MLHEVLEFIQANPDANSYAVCQRFGISRAMSERLLEALEDAGEIVLERPAECLSGGCGTGGTGGAAAQLNQLAAAARQKRAPSPGQ